MQTPSALPTLATLKQTFPVAPGDLALFLFYGALALWVLYSLIVAYHWIRYSHRSPLLIPALLAHATISGSLFLLIASGLP